MLWNGRSGLCSLRIMLRFPVILWVLLRRVRLLWYALVWNAVTVRRADVWLCAPLLLSPGRLLLGGLRIRISAILTLPWE